MEKPLHRVILGVIVGIAFGLSITLCFWGNVWWQVLIAIFAGSIAGLFTVSPKDIIGIFANVFGKNRGLFKEQGFDFSYLQFSKFFRFPLFIISWVISWLFLTKLFVLFISFAQARWEETGIIYEISGTIVVLGLFFSCFFLAYISSKIWFWPYSKKRDIPEYIKVKLWGGGYN